MAERLIGLGQIYQATIESAKLFSSDRETVYPSAALALAQLKAAFPTELSNEQIQSKYDNLRVYSYLVLLGVDMNDYVDMNASLTNENKSTILQEWRQINRKIKDIALHSPDGQRVLDLVHNYQKEILTAERLFTNKTLTKEESVRYRETVNAISLTHLTASVLGYNYLDERIEPITGSITLESLGEKYDWLIHAKPQNDTETRLVGLFNSVMQLQVHDDLNDLAIDGTLGVTSIATVATKTLHSIEEVKSYCQGLIARYESNAIEAGVSWQVLLANRSVFRLMKTLMNWMPKAGGRRERLVGS